MQKNKTNGIEQYNEVIFLLSNPEVFDYINYTEIDKQYKFVQYETKLTVMVKLHNNNTFTIFANSTFLKERMFYDIYSLIYFITYHKFLSLNNYILN
jgi:hypothetical protein